jgi:hypothetical protein
MILPKSGGVCLPAVLMETNMFLVIPEGVIDEHGRSRPAWFIQNDIL